MQTCITKYDHPTTLFYLDPPYWQTEGYGVDFPFDQYEQMANLMRTIKGKAILSINDYPDIGNQFGGFPMDTIAIKYTVGGAQNAAKRQKLIIRNWRT